MVDIQSATAEIRRGIKKDRKKERQKPQGKNIMSAFATHGGHNNNNSNDVDVYSAVIVTQFVTIVRFTKSRLDSAIREKPILSKYILRMTAYNRLETKDLEQAELAGGRQSVDAGGQRRPEGAGHVVKGAIQVRVDVPGGVVVARDIEQESSKPWRSAARPVVRIYTTDRIRCHLLPTQQTTANSSDSACLPLK